MEKKQKKVNKKKALYSRYDPKMDQYEGKVLFPESLARANEKLKNPVFLESLLEFMNKHK